MNVNLRASGQLETSPFQAQSGDWSQDAAADRLALTPRQLEILALIGRGRSNKEIAFALGIRERTVKFHVASLFEKLGTSSRTEALVVGLRLGVVRLENC